MRIGLVIPLFKQAQYLIECVTSALTQTLVPAGLVIVNDGCPNLSSDTLSRAIAAAWPERVLYLRQENRGLSGARNSGVRALLKRWPNIEAILPLDADDWLEEHCLEAMAARLASDDRYDWVYPDLQSFGSEFKNWIFWPKLNLFRLFFENQCPAPSLIRRTVFDADLFFDETMRDGYEDWEFFLRGAIRGFRGASAGNVGVNYRVKDNSMVMETKKKHKQVLKQIHQRHMLSPKILTTYEHKYMPRFRFIDEHGHRYEFSDPMCHTEWKRTPDPEYVPPITIFGLGAALELLRHSRILRGTLFVAQHHVRTHSLRVDLELRENGLRFERERNPGGNPALFAIQSAWLADGSISADNIRSVVSSAHSLAISCPEHNELLKTCNGLDLELLFHHADLPTSGEAESVPTSFENRQASNTGFARAHHFESDETTYPLIHGDEIDVCFVVSLLRSGNIDRCVLKFAEAVKRSIKSVRIHLLVTEFQVVDFDRMQLSVFDEIVFLAACEGSELLQVLSRVLSSMDIVINAHSMQGYQALPFLSRTCGGVHRPICISYLHANEMAANETLTGYPYAPCEYQNQIDSFLVGSEQLRDFLINSGVNEERICIARNAPAVHPPTREQGLLLADRKAARQCCGGYCFELLFVGPLDFQEGLSRLLAFVQLADRDRLNLRLSVAGLTDMGRVQIDWPADRVRLIETNGDVTTLARHFEDADGFILLSRWEGVPLVLLDAMAHGCIVVATDVGAIGELVVDGVNGFLCASSGSDDVIARAALERVKAVLMDPTGCHEMRRRATETAMNLTWDKVAASLDEVLSRTGYANSVRTEENVLGN